jgi:hypothetical protein
MNERENTHTAKFPSGGSAGDIPPIDGAALNAIRESASSYAAAAQAAINKVITGTGNSQAFNNALRQRGGQ